MPGRNNSQNNTTKRIASCSKSRTHHEQARAVRVAAVFIRAAEQRARERSAAMAIRSWLVPPGHRSGRRRRRVLGGQTESVTDASSGGENLLAKIKAAIRIGVGGLAGGSGLEEWHCSLPAATAVWRREGHEDER